VKPYGFLSVFRNRNFSIFCASQTVSQFGDKLDHRALIALLGVLGTGSPSAFAELAFFFTLPVLIFGPISGALVDRWNRKRVMITCDLLRGILVALIPMVVLATGSLRPVYFIVFLVFFFGLFFNNAKMSIIPNMVSRSELLAANSVNTLVGRVATVLAFFVGDLIVYWKGWAKLGVKGWEASFYGDGLTFFISAAAVSVIAVTFKRATGQGREAPKGQAYLTAFSRMFRDVLEGLRLVLASREVSFVMASVVVLTFVGGSVYVLAVPIVQQELHRGAFSVGTLGAILAVGMVIGSFIFGSMGHRVRKSTVITAGFAFIGLVTVLFSSLRSFALTSAAIAVSGIVLAPIMICQDTLLHEVVAEEVRGRVFGTREWTLNLLFMLSAAVMGFIAGLTSARATLRGAGVVILVLGLAGIAARRFMVGERV
jgi:MFS family permease